MPPFTQQTSHPRFSPSTCGDFCKKMRGADAASFLARIGEKRRSKSHSGRPLRGCGKQARSRAGGWSWRFDRGREKTLNFKTTKIISRLLIEQHAFCRRRAHQRHYRSEMWDRQGESERLLLHQRARTMKVFRPRPIALRTSGLLYILCRWQGARSLYDKLLH